MPMLPWLTSHRLLPAVLLWVLYRRPRSTSMLVLLAEIFGPEPNVPAALVLAGDRAVPGGAALLRIIALWKAASSGEAAGAEPFAAMVCAGTGRRALPEQRQRQ